MTILPQPNPFRPTFGVSPTVLAGRTGLVSSFELGLAEGPGNPFRALIISGSRGVGKTVLLNELEDAALRQGWVTLRAYPGPSMVETLVGTSIPEAMDSLGQPRNKRMLTGGSITGLGSITTAADPTSQAPVPTLITRLRQLATILRSRGSGILITTDELQSADPVQLHDVATAVQDLMRDNHDIALVAAGLPAGVEALLQQEGTTFLRRAHRLHLSAVAHDEAAQMFSETAQAGGRRMTEEAVETAVLLSYGYPYLMQVLGSLTWARSTLEQADHLTAEHVGSVVDDVIMRMGIQIHQPSLYGVPPQQLRILYAMADLDPAENPVPTREIARHLGVAPNAISMAREALLHRGLVVVPRYGHLQFALPYLGHYLRAVEQHRP